MSAAAATRTSSPCGVEGRLAHSPSAVVHASGSTWKTRTMHITPKVGTCKRSAAQCDRRGDQRRRGRGARRGGACRVWVRRDRDRKVEEARERDAEPLRRAGRRDQADAEAELADDRGQGRGGESGVDEPHGPERGREVGEERGDVYGRARELVVQERRVHLPESGRHVKEAHRCSDGSTAPTHDRLRAEQNREEKGEVGEVGPDAAVPNHRRLREVNCNACQHCGCHQTPPRHQRCHGIKCQLRSDGPAFRHQEALPNVEYALGEEPEPRIGGEARLLHAQLAMCGSRVCVYSVHRASARGGARRRFVVVECRINTNTRNYSRPRGRPRGEGLAPPLRPTHTHTHPVLCRGGGRWD